MNIQTSITTSLLSAACMFCAGTATIHDTGVDNVMQRMMTLGSYREATPKVSIRKPHTHSERGSLYQAVRDARMSTTHANTGE